MKHYYDKKSVPCVFQPGEKVLVLLPLPGSSLQSRFSGPYTVEKVPPIPHQYHLVDDGLVEKSGLMLVDRLRNSEILNNLEEFLSHLSNSARSDITA